MNASAISVDGIHFKSLLESRIYKFLKESGYSFSYENAKVMLQDKFKPKTLFYRKSKKGMCLDSSTVREITYTPDFIINLDRFTVYIEAKGFKTDSYNIKVKLFRKKLEGRDNVIFAEVKSVLELKKVLDEIDLL